MLHRTLYKIAQRFVDIGADQALCRQARREVLDGKHEHLQRLLLHARDNVPFYAQYLRGASPDNLALAGLPILTKQHIREHFEALRSTDNVERQVFRNSSGGSTGEPVLLLQNREFQAWMAATEDYFYTQFLNIDDYFVTQRLILWGSEQDIFGKGLWRRRLTDWLCRRATVNAFRLSEHELQRCVRLIKDQQPRLIKGYAGALCELAGYILERGLSVPSPAAIYSAAEVLHPFMRERLGRAFRAKVFDFYGSREVGPIAGECAHGSLHVFTFNTHLEVIRDDGQPAAPGEEGRLIVTTLHNFTMPLIRYDIGDRAVQGTRCGCGCTLPVLTTLRGRATDQFVASDGTLVSGEYFTHLLYFRPWVREFQIVQSAVDRIAIHYTGGSPTPGDVTEIESKIRMVLGETCVTEWDFCPELPRTRHGKHLYTVSHVSRNARRNDDAIANPTG